MRQIEKHSSVANKIPSVNVLADGEIALNTHDSKIFQKRSDGALVEHNEWEPKLYEVQDLAARDALTPKNGQYAFYADANSDKILDMWYEGSWVLIQKTPPPPPRFQMKITAPVEPTYTATGGTLTTVDNNDGTWTISSFDSITKIESVSKTDVEIVVESALDLVDITQAWHSCSDLTTFDASGLTSVVTANSAWEKCVNLTSFDTSPLTSVIDTGRSWVGCTSLISFNASGLTSTTSIKLSWAESTSLTSFDTSPLTSAFDITQAWHGCSGLTTFDASGLTFASRAVSSWYKCTGLTSFDTSPLTSVTDVNRAWSGCSGLTTFDASGLISVSYAPSAWANCPFTPNPPINPSTGTNVWP